LFASYPGWIRHQGGDYLLKLYGVDISRGTEGVEIIPVYVPALSVINSGGIRVIEIRLWGDSSLNITLMPFFPFIYFAHNTSSKIFFQEDEE
jgi:hypothetical protein